MKRRAQSVGSDALGGMTVESLASAVYKDRASRRAPIAKSKAWATRGASGILTTFSPVRVTRQDPPDPTPVNVQCDTKRGGFERIVRMKWTTTALNGA